MIDQPIALALNLHWREPEDKGPRLGRARRIALAVRRVVRDWHQASEAEWIARFERPFTETTL